MSETTQKDVSERAEKQLGVLREQKSRLETERQALIRQAREIDTAIAQVSSELAAVHGGIVSLEFALGVAGVTPAANPGG